MAFNDGITDTDKSSIEFRIADSLTRELGTMSVGDLERITSKCCMPSENLALT